MEIAFSKLSANKMVYTSLGELSLKGLVKAKNLFMLLPSQQEGVIMRGPLQGFFTCPSK